MADALKAVVAGVALGVLCAGCGSSSGSPSVTSPGSPESPPPHQGAAAVDSGLLEPSTPPTGAAEDASAPVEPEDASAAGSTVDARAAVSEGGAAGMAAGAFVTGVVSFDPGPCGGFNASALPGIVEGPPNGGGSDHGSTDVVSLGVGGSIVVSFAPNAIVDGPGADFIVFENPFWVAGNSNDSYAEPGEVSVSDDGVTWHTFPCSPTPDPQSAHGTGVDPPYGQCAGWHVVWSNPANGISPTDPSVAGGDSFDLADLGVTQARYVRVVDKTLEACPDAGTGPKNAGFDLDAVSIVHSEHL